MTTSSEDVLVQVRGVRYKKGDGTLYLMSERLAWILDHKDTVSVSHRYADIKLQKISPEGKPKIQLQVVLHDGTTSTFQFVSRQGAEQSIKERDKVKDLLVTLLPKFKRKVNKELEEKNRLLSENPGLLQLYRDLVITQVITSEEFWAQHASQYMNKNDHQKQPVGVSPAFLADIKPQTDGCNGLRYNLTPDIMECIFKTYPAVRVKHRETVPDKLSESQFWTKFFQSHYFHRDRINTATKDIFTDCAKFDDQLLTKEMSKGVEDPMVDVANFEDTGLTEGYGSNSLSDKNPTQNVVHMNMIKRFNQHSIMVLKACSEKRPAEGSAEEEATVNGHETSSPVSNKRKRILEKITYEDLDVHCPDQNTTVPTKLNLSKVERYLEGGSRSMGDSGGSGSSSSLEGRREDVLARLKSEVERWSPHSASHSLVHPATAVAALGELTPGGALMKGYTDDSLAQVVSESLLSEVRGLYRSCTELLRHFWSCFPPTTPELHDKLERMHHALQRLHSARIKPFENKVMLEFSPLSQQLTSHLNQLLSTAHSKYQVWQSRRKPIIPLR